MELLGSVPVALGWVGVNPVAVAVRCRSSLVTRLAAVVRMAFTCDIAETILLSAIFYGTGAGFFGRIGQGEQLAVVVLIWGLLFGSAPPWLARFHIGPLEWLWRRLTYGPTKQLIPSGGVSQSGR